MLIITKLNFNLQLQKMKTNFLTGIAGGVIGALIVSHFWPAFWLAWVAAAGYYSKIFYAKSEEYYKDKPIDNAPFWLWFVISFFIWPFLGLVSCMENKKLEFKFQSPIKIKKQEPASIWPKSGKED